MWTHACDVTEVQTTICPRKERQRRLVVQVLWHRSAIMEFSMAKRSSQHKPSSQSESTHAPIKLIIWVATSTDFFLIDANMERGEEDAKS